jgi:hypothetical protein
MKPEKTQFRVCAPTTRMKEGKETTVYPTVGAAFLNPGESNEDYSISVKLDSIPIHFGGELVLFVKREREAAAK